MNDQLHSPTLSRKMLAMITYVWTQSTLGNSMVRDPPLEPRTFDEHNLDECPVMLNCFKCGEAHVNRAKMSEYSLVYEVEQGKL